MYNGTETIRVTNNAVAEFAPILDGRWLAYLNQTAGLYYFNLYDVERRVFLRGFNASEVRQGSARHFDAADFQDGLLVWSFAEDLLAGRPATLFVYNTWTDSLTSIRLEGIRWAWGGGWEAKRWGSGGLITSAGWIFLSALPMGEGDIEIYAFQPLRGHVSHANSGYEDTGFGSPRRLVVNRHIPKPIQPLKNVKVDVDLGGGRVITVFTDEDGYFTIPLPVRLSAIDPPPMFRVTLTQRNNKFGIIDYSRWDRDNVVTYSTRNISAIKVNDHLVRLNATVLSFDPATETSMDSLENIDDAAYIYYRTHQAYELARDVLLADWRLDRRIDVRIFSHEDRTYFDEIGGRPFINIRFDDSRKFDDDEPDNREWHEFGHAVMWFSPIGGRHNLPTLNGVNHGRYENPDSSDSWVEGFAIFYSMLVDHFIERGIYASLYKWSGAVYSTNLDYNNFANWFNEDFAAASILWDLFDTGDALGRDDDNVSIEIRLLWQRLLDANVQNLHGLWEAFKDAQYVDLLFQFREIYEDLNGDKHWGRNEPIGTSRWALIYFDRNNDGNFDRLEMIGTANQTEIDAARTRGRVAIESRPGRPAIPPIPGSAVLLNLVDKDAGSSIQDARVNITVMQPKPYGSYSYVMKLANSSGTFYMYLPDDSDISASITVSSEGYTSSRPFIVNGSFYHAKIFENRYLLNGTRPSFLTISGSLERVAGTIRRTTYEVAWDGRTYPVEVVSNSTILNFSFKHPLKQISYTIQGPSGTRGFSNITIPNELMSGAFAAFVDDKPIALTLAKSATQTFLHLTYEHAPRSIRIVSTQVIPEFPLSITMLMAGLVISLLLTRFIVARTHNRKDSSNWSNDEL